MKQSFRQIIFISLAICLVSWLAACTTVMPSTESPATSIASPTVNLVIATPTVTPSPSPVAPFAVLLAPPGSDSAQVNALQTALNDTITQAGLQWQVRQQLTMNDMVPELKLVVAVPPDPGLAEFVTQGRGTQFLALDIPDLTPAPNLTTINTQDVRPDQQGFVAGEIAAMLSEDWRVGTISLSDTTEGRSARSGFLNGVVYFCGLCRPVHPPFYEYPTYVELPATATTAEWQEAANYMVDHAVRSVYVYPQAGDEAMLSILAQAGINIISSGNPPAAASSTWAVSLTAEPITFIQKQVAGLLEGTISGGHSLYVPIEFTNINPSFFTPGKQRLAQQTLSDLQAGYIDTGVDLTTGEKRP
ncbi:MAG: hypothetical protein C3F13_05985 [Anaerolineales bacterium]|nr:MAG: hypothetical protein C3F13_05985 [Anaerolineales bacterium]